MSVMADGGRRTKDKDDRSLVFGPSSLVVIVGPTASGKTALSIELAAALGGEIVSADSRQIYRGMDIGTAKAIPEQRARVPHHLIDVVSPDTVLTLAEYQRLAYVAIDDIFAVADCRFSSAGQASMSTRSSRGGAFRQSSPGRSSGRN